MQTKVQNMQNYYGYIKCGEIFKSPTESYQCPYVLKCFQCKETYMLLESFIFHLEVNCKDFVAKKSLHREENEGANDNAVQNNKRLHRDGNEGTTDNAVQNNNTNEDKMQFEEEEGLENITVKIELDVLEMDDPLIVVKSETGYDDDIPTTKEHSNLSENLIKIKTDVIDAIENIDENEETLEESTSDEIESEDSESDEQESVQKSTFKQKCSNKFKIKQFMKSQANVSLLIAAYKNQPSLWNKNLPTLRYKEKRQEYLQQIANELKNKADILVTWEQVAAIIVHISQKYREDLKGLKSNDEPKEGSSAYIPLWYFEELYFLKPFAEKNLIAKLGLYLPELLPQEIIQILNIYKGFPNLWNTQIIEFYCKNKRNEAIQEMLQSLETNMNLKISEHILEEYLRTVHNCFSRAKRKHLNMPKKGEKKDVDDEENKEDYYEHMIFLFDHVGPFKCSECERETKTALMYKIHKSQHDGSAPLTCSVCQREFTSPSTYINHAKRHMEDTKFECKECGKKFYASRELNIHMRNHTGTKPFTCEICGASFRHVQGFTNHHRRHEKNYLHTCHICSKGYYTMDRYKDHMNAHTNTRTHICNACGKAFINKKGLQQHEVIHEDIRRYSCKLCGKTFKHKTGVNQHMRTHGVPKSEEHTVNKGLDKI